MHINTDMLNENQYGFRPKRSTTDAILDLTQMIIENAFNRNQNSLCLFFDLSKAFDTIKHNILLSEG